MSANNERLRTVRGSFIINYFSLFFIYKLKCRQIQNANDEKIKIKMDRQPTKPCLFLTLELRTNSFESKIKNRTDDTRTK